MMTTKANITYDGEDMIKFQYKIVLLGNENVGKTALVRRYYFNEFRLDTACTIGMNFISASLPAIQDNDKFRIGISIWDFGGQERFRPLMPQFLTSSHGALLIFDLTSRKSLDNIRLWHQLVIDNVGNIPMHLVGTKRDLYDEKTSCTPIMIRKVQNDLDIPLYTETSAKNSFNIDAVFRKQEKIQILF
jgi:Ras-related protein Rab-6A